MADRRSAGDTAPRANTGGKLSPTEARPEDSGVGGQDVPPPVSPHPGRGALLRLARLSGIRAGASLHERWGDGAFLSGSRCLAAAHGCQPRELAWEEVLVGVVIVRAGLGLGLGPSLSPALQADLGHPQESGALGGGPRGPSGIPPGSPETELGSCQALSVISGPNPSAPTSGLSACLCPWECPEAPGPGRWGQDA